MLRQYRPHFFECSTLRMLRFRQATLLLVLALLASLPLTLRAATSSTPGLEKVRLQLKWKHQFQFAGYYAAIAQGYYREAGLEVELLEPGDGEDPVGKVLGGAADYGISASELVLHRAQGQPVVALAAIFQHSPLQLLVTQQTGSIHALAGQPLMLMPHEAELQVYLAREGVRQWVHIPHDYHSSVQALRQGQVRAISAYATNEPFALEQAGVAYQQFSPRAAGIDFYGDTLFTTEARLQAHPEQVRAFRAASLKGWDYAMQHPEEMIRLIMQRYTPAALNPEVQLEKLRFEARHTEPLLQAALVAVGHMYPGRWQHIAEIYREAGQLPGSGASGAPIDWDKFLYNPNPPVPDLGWLYWTLAATLLLLAVIAAVALYILRLNRYLTSSEKRFRTVFDAVPVALIVSDLDGTIVDWNQGSANIFGWTPAEAIGQNLYALLVPVPCRTDVQVRVRETLESSQPTSSINENLTREGRIITCDWSNARFHDKNDRVIGIISLGIDVTAREQAQAQLRAAKEIAELALSDQRQFLAMASHEFRSPLAVIDSSVQLLAAKTSQVRGVETLIQRIRRGIRRMTTFLENYLTSDRFDSSGWAVQQETIEIHLFLQALVEQSQALAGNEHEILLDSDELPTVCYGDRRLLTVLLQNLLDNAVKYSPEGGEIVLRGCLDDKDGSLCLSVSDAGIGIAPEEQEKIFNRYYRSSTVATISGAGLGLALVKRIIDLQGGRLSIESDLGAGACFTVYLPQPRQNSL